MKRIVSRKNRIGFTLIELLVVISIIALLVSILMPSLNRARGMAKVIVCKANLKNLFIAEMFYVDDFDGWLPSPQRTKQFGGYWPFRPKKGYSKDDDPQSIPETMGLNALFNDLNYIDSDSDVWSCPDPASRELADEYGVTYAYSYAGMLGEKKFVTLHKRNKRSYLFADNFVYYAPTPNGFYVGKTSKPISTIPPEERKEPHKYLAKKKKNDYGEDIMDYDTWMLVAMDGFIGTNLENKMQMGHYKDDEE